MTPLPKDSDETKHKVKSTLGNLMSSPKGEEIVISGCSGSFPDSDGVQMFHEKLMNKVDLVTDDDRRWSSDHPEIPQRTGKIFNIEKFDAGFFGVHSKQANVMDPTMRIALERVYEAIVDAGVNPASLRGTNTGVFNGTCFSESEKTWFYDNIDMDGLGVVNCSRAAQANRISYWLGLNSLSYVADTACSSSLYALERAYFAMRHGYCDAAIVLGCSLCLHPFVSLQFSRLGVLAPDGKCKSFDAAANGYCRSEGVPVIFLQKAKDARRVYARVVHAKTNCDGFKEEGITYPSRKMQLKLLQQFYEECSVDSATVSYVEAHGTGTRVGDPEECNALDEVFCKGRKEELLIGSIKSNMGHSEPSSGLCSIIKSIVTFESGIIPPNLHYFTPREGISGLLEGRLKVVTEPTPLPGNKGLIGINSFGFGGANAHVLLEWNHKRKINGGAPSDNIPRLINISGRHEEAINVIFDDVKSRSLDVEFVHLLNELHSDHFPGHNARGFGIFTAAGEKKRVVTTVHRRDVKNEDITFVFPGLGYQTTGMGRSLMKLPPFSASIEVLSKALSFTDIDLYSILTDDDVSFDNILNSVVAVVACQIGIVDSLASVGVYPKHVLGYSIGEIAGAYSVKNLTAEQAIQVAYFVGKSMVDSMLTNTLTINIGLAAHRISEYQSNGVEISAINDQNSVSLVGPVNIIRRLKATLMSKNVKVDDINMSGVGLHSQYVTDTESKLTAYLKKVIPHPMPRNTKWISSGMKKKLRYDTENVLCSAEYFVQSLLNPIEFKHALNKLPKDTIILNIGPKNILKDQLAELSSQFIETFDPTDGALQFLDSLGMLYLSQVNLAVSNLYPKVEYPVSRGTAMISPLIRWDHRRDWFVNAFKETEKKSGGETKHTISLKSEDDSFVAGHMIDGRILYPATGYVNLVFDDLREITGDVFNDVMTVFRDVHFLRATPLTDNSHEFIVSVEKTTGNFEILEGGALVVTGTVSFYADNESQEQWADASVLNHNQEDNVKKVILSKKDIYKELRLRGYNYTGLFRGLEDVESSGRSGLVSWHNNWVSFMDTMLQMQILNLHNRDLFVPTYIGKIIIDVKSHMNALQKCQDQENPRLPINYYKDVNVIKAGGVEIWNLRAQQIPRRKPTRDAVLERYTFTPNNLKLTDEEDGLQETARVLVHLALENLQGAKVKVLELADDEYSENFRLLAPLVSSILDDLPLVQADVRVVTAPESFHGRNAVDLVVIDETAVQTEKDCSIVIGANLLSRKDVLKQLRGCLKEYGFIISRDTKINNSEPELTVLAEYTTGPETIKLIRKSKPSLNETRVVPVTSDDNFQWIELMKEALASKAQQVIAFAQNDETSGILGLVNCLLQEPSGEKIRCIYIRDKTAPPFDINLPFYADQLSKQLIFNVFENGVWGSYRHHIMPTLVAKPCQHVYINNRVKGDLSSLTVFEGPFNKPLRLQELSQTPHTKVYYTAINFRDVMVASGKIVLPGSLSSNSELEIGLEYSGINEKGERVMGCLPSGALTSCIIGENPYTTWKVPDGMSLEDAATIPIVYMTAYRAIVVCGKSKRGEKILIHAAAGGVGIAAINISLALGLEIFATVGSAEKRKFLRENFPQIPDSHIGNSRDVSFEDMVKTETNNRGVDLVLNSLAEEKMHASLRCLAPKGRFLEIGKYDLLNNVSMAAEPFLKNISYHSVMLDVALEGSESLQETLLNDMENLLKKNLIKPLPRTVFDFYQSEQAFRYMTSGKHIGKIILKVCDENEPDNATKTFDAVPRYFCNPNFSYIVLGGLGGFGLELANWLVSRGARYLVLTSRTGVQNGYQGNRILTWESVGTRVHVATDNISTEDGVFKLLNDANALAPVAGIFNLAVVLKDSIFENQTIDTFRQSFEAKAIATALLDKLSRVMCPLLTEFVVFSSVSCGRGNPGQSNYGMSNSVMERICEKRQSEGLPGLAVQWGAVGEVGLVAEMAETNLQLVIGGTLQQTINSCLQSMDAFLNQDSPVVASMVVAEKRSGRKTAGTIVETVCSILGIRDLKTVSHNTSLSELGMDSMTAVEIKQTLEREYEVFLSAQDLRGMTFSKLAAMDKVAFEGKAPKMMQAVGLNVFVQDLPPQSEVLLKEKPLNSISSELSPVFVIPGLDGLTSTLMPAVQKVERPALALIYPHNNPENISITKTAELMLPTILEHLADNDEFNIVGYSAGSLIAIELASLLEEGGRKGHLILIDGSPMLIAALLKAFIITESTEELENVVIIALQEALLPEHDKSPYLEMTTWEEKWNYLKTLVANTTEHSEEYLKACANDLIMRLKNLITYKTHLGKPLKSKISLIKPKEMTNADVMSEDFDLHTCTEQPVEIHVVDGNHVTMLNEPQLALILAEMTKNEA